MTEPWLDIPDTLLYHGDAAAVLAELPAQSVQAIITSPPYYGLRDYGTATWAGGSIECDHLESQASRTAASASASTLGGGKGNTHRSHSYGSQCKRCGAYRVDQQLGLEDSLGDYIERLAATLAIAREALRGDGTLWLVLGDTYATRWSSRRPKGRAGLGEQERDRSGAVEDGFKGKGLMGVPWRVALALQDDGWILRNAIIWEKPNAMPSSARDRFTASYEHVFLLAKQARYHFDADALREPATAVSIARGNRGRLSSHAPPGQAPQIRTPRIQATMRHPRDVWRIPTASYKGAHFAVFPPELARRCILASTRPGDFVLDPFVGSGTTLLAARQHDRLSIGIDLNEDYLQLAAKRLAEPVGDPTRS